MKTFKLMIVLFLSVQMSAFALNSWEEDLDGDGRKETKFYDDDNDGTPDTASVDRDGDGKYEEYWVDEDDDGNWDRMWFDKDGDGQFEKGFQDTDDDSDWDQKWEDKNGNNKVDPGERVPYGGGDPDEPRVNPRPVTELAAREECNCAGPEDEPEFVEGGVSPISTAAIIIIAIIIIVLIWFLYKMRTRKK